MRSWTKVGEHYVSNDGYVVEVDNTVSCNTSSPWLKNYRGWIARCPDHEEHWYLGFYRKNSALYIPRKFKTPEAAMGAVDREYPLGT